MHAGRQARRHHGENERPRRKRTSSTRSTAPPKPACPCACSCAAYCVLRGRRAGAQRKHRGPQPRRPLLEHSRIYRFENGGESEVYIGSATGCRAISATVWNSSATPHARAPRARERAARDLLEGHRPRAHDVARWQIPSLETGETALRRAGILHRRGRSQIPARHAGALSAGRELSHGRGNRAESSVQPTAPWTKRTSLPPFSKNCATTSSNASASRSRPAPPATTPKAAREQIRHALDRGKLLADGLAKQALAAAQSAAAQSAAAQSAGARSQASFG